MELRQLRYFLRVAEEGSINRAATALHMTQPSLSHSIKTLENSLGVLLFVRGGAGVVLTKHGERFRGHATHILREAEKVTDEMGRLAGKGPTKLTIGVVNAFSLPFFSRILGRFMEGHPDTIVESYTFGNKDNVVESLSSSHWDVALSLQRADRDLGPDIEVVKLAESESTVYCGAMHPLAKSKAVTVEELASYDWAVTSGNIGDRLLKEQFFEHGISPKIRFRANSINQMVSAIQSAPILCIAPTVTVVDELAQGRVVQVDQEYFTVPTWIVLFYSKLSIRTPDLISFMNICANEAEQRF
jgi:LysR family cyn operon transcriptional activator